MGLHPWGFESPLRHHRSLARFHCSLLQLSDGLPPRRSSRIGLEASLIVGSSHVFMMGLGTGPQRMKHCLLDLGELTRPEGDEGRFSGRGQGRVACRLTKGSARLGLGMTRGE